MCEQQNEKKNLLQKYFHYSSVYIETGLLIKKSFRKLFK
jgi:hypothetical protein